MHPFIEGYFKLVKRFIPSKPVPTSVGIDVGLNECKLVELKRVGKDFIPTEIKIIFSLK